MPVFQAGKASSSLAEDMVRFHCNIAHGGREKRVPQRVHTPKTVRSTRIAALGVQALTLTVEVATDNRAVVVRLHQSLCAGSPLYPNW